MLDEQSVNEDGGELDNQPVEYHQYYQRPPLSKGQKIAVAVLAFFSFFIIIIWVMQFKQSISAPLSGTKTVTDSTATDTEAVETVNMTKDTDGDGLTDYNELNTYKTSPYLEDSDSDGFSDKIELDSDKDPNCPTGANCEAAIVSSVATSTGDIIESNTVQNTGNSALTPATSVPVNNQTTTNLTAPTTANTADLQKVLAGQMDAASLRKMLLDSGMDAATLGKISDEALMASYKETLNK